MRVVRYLTAPGDGPCLVLRVAPGAKGLLITALVAVVHGLVSLGLIVLVLLHGGRGGGMSDMFGGGMGPGGGTGATVMEKNLDRLTVVVAILFSITTVLLSWLLN